MKFIIVQRTRNLSEISMKLSKRFVKIIHIPNYSKLSHCAMYFDVTSEAFIQELTYIIHWQFLTVFLHLLHRIVQLARFRFYGQVVRMNKSIDWLTMARGVQIILFHFCRHLFIMNSIMAIKQDHLLW